MTTFSDPVADTVTAQWWAELIGPGPGQRSHHQTKVAYYRAVRDLLSARPAGPLSWRSITAAVVPKGCPSTFYKVTGAHASHPLLGSLLAAGDSDSIQTALCYRRGDPVDQLVDETKVWSFWPFREGWLTQCRQRGGAGGTSPAESLPPVVAEWARCHPALATALDHAPPVCAVEDLTLARRGQLAPTRVFSTLAATVRAALAAPADLIDYPPDSTAAEPDLPRGRPPTSDALLVDLAERIFAMKRELRWFAPRDADTVCQLARDLMRDAQAVLA